MIILLAALARAEAPPGLDLEDAHPYEAAASAILAGPPGCWEIVGRAAWDYNLGKTGGNRGTAAFAGRLDQGTWTGFRVEPLGEISHDLRSNTDRQFVAVQRFSPLVGKHPHIGYRISLSSGVGAKIEASPDAGAKQQNVLDTVLAELTGPVETTWLSWDDDRHGVVLHRSMDIQSGGAVDETLFFPGQGTVPVALDVDFPDPFPMPGGGPMKVLGASVHVRSRDVGGVPMPAAETYRFRARILTFEATFSQTIQYLSALPCSDK